MIAVLVTGYGLGIASVFVAAWTRLRVLEARERRELVDLHTDPAAVPSATVVSIYRHTKARP